MVARIRPEFRMTFQVVAAERLYRRVAAQIAGLISDGSIARGERLPAERDLAIRLGVSRPTLREALIALEIAGLVEVRTGSGIYVRETPATDETEPARLPELGVGPLELIDARLVVECAITRAAAPLAAEEDCAALEARVAEMDAAPDPAAHLAADRAFHHDLAAISGNAVLAATVDGLWGETFSPIFRRMGLLTGLYPVSRNGTRADHLLIVAALRTRDPDAAEAAMRAHLNNVRGVLMGAAGGENPAEARVDGDASA